MLSFFMIRTITREYSFDLGAAWLPDGSLHFRVWAPGRQRVDLHQQEPVDILIPMEATGDGYFEAVIDEPVGEIRYTYSLDGETDRPDPASRYQPGGVHAPSAVPKPNFEWKSDSWRGIPLADYVFYEIHVGAFTAEGTFAAAIGRIPHLKNLGVTAVELMPVAQNPGERNWGYDGVYPYAVQASYGGPEGLKRFVDACHENGIAVVLDVVYNHLGPEGNYLRDFGPYFTDRHRTPWGEAINYDGPESEPVRHFFIQNALYWVTEYRIDALRLDATDTIYDLSPRHLLAELAEEIHDRAEALNRRIYAIAESAANDSRWIRVPEQGGFGLDAQWNDDYHHALRRTLTGEDTGYYADYPDFSHVVKGLRDGFIYTGEYSAYRKRRHGNASADLPPKRFVVCCQNHDQVGNRMLGDRLGHKIDHATRKLAAAWVILSPYLPLLFMGEEYNEPAPFPYFVNHTDPGLIEAVRNGRKEEFRAFAWAGEPPDPQAEETFLQSKIHPELCEEAEHAALFRFYQALLRLRRAQPALAHLSRKGMTVDTDTERKVVSVVRRYKSHECFLVFNFGEEPVAVGFPGAKGAYRKLLDSTDEAFGGAGSQLGVEFALKPGEALSLAPRGVVVFCRI